MVGANETRQQEAEDWDALIAQYRDAVRNEPRNAEYFTELGYAYLGKREYKQAEKACLNAIRLDPTISVPYFNLASIYHEMGDDEKALSYLHKCLRIKPVNADTYGLLGWIHESLGNYEVAAAAYRESLMRDPENAERCFDLCRMLGLTADVEGAMFAVREAVRLDPNDPDYRWGLGHFLFDAGDFEGGRQAFRSAVRLEFDRFGGKVPPDEAEMFFEDMSRYAGLPGVSKPQAVPWMLQGLMRYEAKHGPVPVAAAAMTQEQLQHLYSSPSELSGLAPERMVVVLSRMKRLLYDWGALPDQEAQV